MNKTLTVLLFIILACFVALLIVNPIEDRQIREKAYTQGFEDALKSVPESIELPSYDYDSNMVFERFITSVTDNQGLSRLDFDIELPFDSTESGDVIVKVHINKGDVLEEK